MLSLLGGSREDGGIAHLLAYVGMIHKHTFTGAEKK